MPDTNAALPRSSMSRAPSVAAAALLLAASILASRLLGYLRDVVLAWQYGASAQTDAYRWAGDAEETARRVALLRRVEREVIDDAGHMAPMEQPDAVTQALSHWLDTCPGARP